MIPVFFKAVKLSEVTSFQQNVKPTLCKKSVLEQQELLSQNLIHDAVQKHQLYWAEINS